MCYTFCVDAIVRWKSDTWSGKLPIWVKWLPIWVKTLVYILVAFYILPNLLQGNPINTQSWGKVTFPQENYINGLCKIIAKFAMKNIREYIHNIPKHKPFRPSIMRYEDLCNYLISIGVIDGILIRIIISCYNSESNINITNPGQATWRWMNIWRIMERFLLNRCTTTFTR